MSGRGKDLLLQIALLARGLRGERGKKVEKQRLYLICVSLSEWVVGKGILGRGGFRNLRPVGREVWRGKVYCTVQYSTVHRVDGLGC
jgi:hypothetical protein